MSMAAGHSANEAHGTEKGISGLIVEKYKEKMDGLKKKRSRFPVEDAEVRSNFLTARSQMCNDREIPMCHLEKISLSLAS